MPKKSAKLDVTIIGGTGWAGNLLAVFLAHQAHLSVNLTVIDKKNYWVWNPALPRQLADPKKQGVATRPIDSVTWSGVGSGKNTKFHFRDAKFIHGEATLIDAAAKTVTVKPQDGGEDQVIAHDLLVVATGSAYRGIFRPTAPDCETADRQFHDLHLRLRAAKHVLVVGHGPVGCEMAGELRTAAGPEEKGGPKITLVGPGPPLGSNNKGAQKKVAAKLTKMGIALVDGKVDVADIPDYPTEDVGPDGSPIVRDVPLLAGGSSIEKVDCIIKAAGSTLNTGIFANSPTLEGALDTDGHVKVDKTFRVVGFPHIVALGDIVKIVTPKPRPFKYKLAYVAELHVHAVQGRIRSLARLCVRKGGVEKAGKQVETFKLGTMSTLMPKGIQMVTLGGHKGVLGVGWFSGGTLIHALSTRGFSVFQGKACGPSKFKSHRPAPEFK